MNAKRRLKNRKGFSLAETLLAVAILLLVSVIVANGVPAARNAYYKVVLASNAQSLLSTTVAALRDELGTAWNVSAEGTTITYFNADNGAMTTLTAENDGIYVTEYLTSARYTADTSADVPGQKYLLVPAAAASDGTYIKYTGVDASQLADAGTGNVLTIKGLQVCMKNSEIVLASLDTDLAIRVLSAHKETISTLYQ